MRGTMQFFRKKAKSNKADRTLTGVRLTIESLSLPDDVARYVALLETEQSANWCKCTWRIHPDDQKIRSGHCRVCGERAHAPVHEGLPEDIEMGEAHRFKGIRRTRVDDHPFCPVHTREGLIAGFVEWLADNG